VFVLWLTTLLQEKLLLRNPQSFPPPHGEDQDPHRVVAPIRRKRRRKLPLGKEIKLGARVMKFASKIILAALENLTDICNEKLPSFPSSWFWFSSG
jgi:hypothetical protein